MKAHEFDKKIKGQVKKVEGTAPAGTAWDINKSWDKLSQLLKQASPKSLVWYFSLAASVSMVMANVTLFQDDWQSTEEPQKSVENTNEIMRASSNLAGDTPEEPNFSQLHAISSKKVHSIPSLLTTNSTLEITPGQQPIVFQQVIESKNRVIPKLNSSIGTSGVTFSGEVILMSNKRIKNINLGMSLEMNSQLANSFDKKEALPNLRRQALYMNMVVINDKAKRPWSARIGTPLWQTNAADSTAPMIKMNYQTKVGNKVQIGPEIILTKGFKRVYPGISLSFG